ncbi:MAG: hypothetical protein WCW13_01425 [archaeon]|jgi:hypothetical protein
MKRLLVAVSKKIADEVEHYCQKRKVAMRVKNHTNEIVGGVLRERIRKSNLSSAEKEKQTVALAQKLMSRIILDEARITNTRIDPKRRKKAEEVLGRIFTWLRITEKHGTNVENHPFKIELNRQLAEVLGVRDSRRVIRQFRWLAEILEKQEKDAAKK